MKISGTWLALRERAVNLARRFPRATVISGVVCLVVAFLPYYSHTVSDGPSEVDLPFFGKIKGPPERTHFHVGLPWSPWVRYWRVLEYQGPFAFNYSYGFDSQILPGSAVPAVLGVVLLVVARISRRSPASKPAGTGLTPSDSSQAIALEDAGL